MRQPRSSFFLIDSPVVSARLDETDLVLTLPATRGEDAYDVCLLYTSGTASYDPETNTLTLDGANILNTKAENGWGSARGLYNMTKGLTIKLIGDNSIVSEQSGGIANGESITFTGEGSLKVTGTSTGKDSDRYGILNMGKITVQNCSLEVSAGLYGLKSGKWAFEKCNVRTQGGADGASFGALDAEPTFTSCSITAPSNTQWVKNKSDLYNLCDAEGKTVSDLVKMCIRDRLSLWTALAISALQNILGLPTFFRWGGAYGALWLGKMLPAIGWLGVSLTRCV